MKDSILFVAAVGLSTDLTIQQVMMKSLKIHGGLTHGRGMSKNVRLTWVKYYHQVQGNLALTAKKVFNFCVWTLQDMIIVKLAT